MRRRHERGVLQVLARQVGDAVQAGEVEWPRQLEDLVGGDAELGDEQVEHLGVDRLLDLEPDRRPELAAQQLLLEGLEEVLGVVLLHLEVLVAGDPERVGGDDLHAREEPLQVLADDVLERHEALVAQRHEALEDRWHLDPGEVLGAQLGMPDEDGEVQREPGDVGERVGRVDRERREHREDALLEQPLAVLLLLAVELVPAEQLDPFLAQARAATVPRERPRLALHQLPGRRPDVLEHLAGQHAGGGAYGDPRGDPALETGHAHHEELVEVAAEDRQEPGPLQERQRVVLGQLEHALVEPQPRELAVEEPVVVLLDGCELRLVGDVRRLDVERVVGVPDVVCVGRALVADRTHGRREGALVGGLRRGHASESRKPR